MELTWHKDAAGSYYATHNGRRIATARKERGAWIGTVVGLGFTFGGRRLLDVKELAHRHAERIYGEGEWTLFPVRDLRPGMVLGCDTWRGEEREIVSVSVDTDAQTVDVELSSESSRELGFTLDATYAVGEYVRVKVQEETPTRAEDLAEGDVIRLYDCDVRVTAVDCDPSPSVVDTVVSFVRVSGPYVGMTGRKVWSKAARVIVVKAKEETPEPAPVRTLDDPADAQALAEYEADQRDAEESATCDARRSGWERPGPGRHRLPCILPARHGGLHRDALRAEWLESEAGQVIDLHPFTAVVDVIAGTGVLISPPAAEDVTLSEGGASLHDSLLADALRRLLPLGVEALEGEDGGLSIEGVTEDGRKVFSLYVSDCITTEPDFEEVAASIEALRQAAGL
ncbi:hypothetical protein ACFUV1_18710 [Streptomyces griseoincarnatus]